MVLVFSSRDEAEVVMIGVFSWPEVYDASVCAEDYGDSPVLSSGVCCGASLVRVCFCACLW